MTSSPTDPTTDAATASYSVTGMTCGHCVNAVSSELRQLPGVTGVDIDLVAGGTSTLTVTSAAPLSSGQVAVALDDAGDYDLAD